MTEKMCDICGESPAVVHMKEIENDKVTHLDLCRSCAEKRGYSVGAAASGNLQDLAQKLVSMAQEVTGSQEAEGIRCTSCGLFYTEFTQVGRLGCPDCYTAFATQLRPLLRRTHGSATHQGRRPQESPALREERRELRQMRADLDRAIRREEFERAAAIRDQIQKLEERVRGQNRREDAS